MRTYAALLVALCVSTPLFAQHAVKDCTDRRGPVRTGGTATNAPVLGDATRITAEDFRKITWPTPEDPTTWPTTAAPDSPVEGEGTLYTIEDAFFIEVTTCGTAMSIDFKNEGGSTVMKGMLPSQDCLTGPGGGNITGVFNTWHEQLRNEPWNPDSCPQDHEMFRQKKVRVTGALFWDDDKNIHIPVPVLSPIYRLEVLDPDTGEPEDPDGGEIDPVEPPPPFQVALPTDFDVEPFSIQLSDVQELTFTTAVTGAFDNDLELTVNSNASETDDFHVSVTPNVIPAPGIGQGTIQISTGPMTFPKTYTVTLTATAGGQSFSRSFEVIVACDPPFVLGIDQPKSITANNGDQVELEVKPSGSGPYLYQWYRGTRGMTRDPIQGANTAKLIFTTRQSEVYWVRISNACGSVDSGVATVTTTGELNGPARRRSGR